jgi:hypothetical protein
MRSIISRWFMFGLLLGWAVAHATVFAQGNSTSPAVAQPGVAQPGVARTSVPQPGATTPAQPAPAGKVATTTPDKLRQGLDKTITIDYVGQSLHDVLNHFRDRTNLPINVDQMAFMHMGINGEVPMTQVEVKAKNEKASSVLRRLLSGHRLSYVVLEDSLLVTTEEMAVVRQMRQRVSVDVDEVPLKKAARDLAKSHGINLVFDPLVKQTVDTQVTLQLDNTGIETALRLLAELANLKAVRMGNVMFITSEAKAKKIREEEPHQFDNPLNPNIPGGFPPIAIDRIGGGFGGAVPPNIGVAPGGLPVPMPMPIGPDGVVPVPPPGIDLPPAPPQRGGDDPAQPAPKRVIDIRDPMAPPPPPIPQATPSNTPAGPPAPPARRIGNER